MACAPFPTLGLLRDEANGARSWLRSGKEEGTRLPLSIRRGKGRRDVGIAAPSGRSACRVYNTVWRVSLDRPTAHLSFLAVTTAAVANAFVAAVIPFGRCRRRPPSLASWHQRSARPTRGPMTTGARQLLAFTFGSDSTFEGQLVGALERIESGGSVRVLDGLFVARAP